MSIAPAPAPALLRNNSAHLTGTIKPLAGLKRVRYSDVCRASSPKSHSVLICSESMAEDVDNDPVPPATTTPDTAPGENPAGVGEDPQSDRDSTTPSDSDDEPKRSGADQIFENSGVSKAKSPKPYLNPKPTKDVLSVLAKLESVLERPIFWLVQHSSIGGVWSYLTPTVENCLLKHINNTPTGAKKPLLVVESNGGIARCAYRIGCGSTAARRFRCNCRGSGKKRSDASRAWSRDDTHGPQCRTWSS